MKQMLLMFAVALAVAGCGSLSPAAPEQPAVAPAIVQPRTPDAMASKRNPDVVIANDGNGTVVIRKVESRPGVSSATVEKLARSVGCTGSGGAGLITEKGPLEVYRMQCDNGTTFMAKCELRQCKPLR